MSETYSEVLTRLIEERKRLHLSQKEMACIVHITQSNYSKAEKGLHRLSYEEVKYLAKGNVDVLYMFTGDRSEGRYMEYFQGYSYDELYYYLAMIYSLVNLKGYRSNTEQWNVIANRIKYVPIILGFKKSTNLFLILRYMTHNRQKAMAEKLGVDIKKFRELEKDRCLPDSEIIWKLYDLFQIPPTIVLKDRDSMLSEISFFLESIEERGIDVMDVINKV